MTMHPRNYTLFELEFFTEEERQAYEEFTTRYDVRIPTNSNGLVIRNIRTGVFRFFPDLLPPYFEKLEPERYQSTIYRLRTLAEQYFLAVDLFGYDASFIKKVTAVLDTFDLEFIQNI